MVKHNIIISTNRYIPKHMKDALKKKSKLRCAESLFWKKCSFSKKKLSEYDIDHIKPMRFGGRTLLYNLQILCLNCHRSKSNKESYVAPRLNNYCHPNVAYIDEETQYGYELNGTAVMFG